jgi:hypothetical protein
MALSQSDLDALDAAIASAELTVTVDGKSVTYRSITELKRAREHVASVLAAQSGRRRSVFYFTPAGRRD